MITYQDLQAVTEDGRGAFLEAVVREHRASVQYRDALDAQQYYRHRNPTIMRAQKMISNIFGDAVPDVYAANNKIPCRYYHYFITQLTGTLLSCGADFGKPETRARLGADFDLRLRELTVEALNGGAAFGYFNHDRMQVFSLLEFAPLYDEETGALCAGVRFWQISPEKPMRYTLYEPDGVTEYIHRPGEALCVLRPKTPYLCTVTGTRAGGVESVSYAGYGRLPILPLYNTCRQSEIVGCREVIDAYDLMLSQLTNNVSDGSVIYWVLKNCGGMTEEEMEEYVTRLARTHVSRAGDNEGAVAEPHSVEVPFEANAEALDRLRRELFDSFMALDVSTITSGNTTATQIRAAYEPLWSKADLLEAQLDEFLAGLLSLLGIDDAPKTFKRSSIVNQTEETAMILSALPLIGEAEAVRRLPWLSPDECERILKERNMKL